MKNRPYGRDYHFNAFQDAEPLDAEYPFDGSPVPGSEWEDYVELDGGQYVEDGVTLTDKNSGGLFFQTTHTEIDDNGLVKDHLIVQLKGQIGK